MRIAKNFTLEELTKSQQAERLGLDNSPQNPEHLINLVLLAQNILQPVRNAHGTVIISSGYRTVQVNRAIGSKSATSQHCIGQAADFECIGGISNYDLAVWIQGNLDFDQLILECYDSKKGMNSGWIHCSFNLENNRSEKLTASFENGEMNYQRGLIG